MPPLSESVKNTCREMGSNTGVEMLGSAAETGRDRPAAACPLDLRRRAQEDVLELVDDVVVRRDVGDVGVVVDVGGRVDVPASQREFDVDGGVPRPWRHGRRRARAVAGPGRPLEHVEVRGGAVVLVERDLGAVERERGCTS